MAAAVLGAGVIAGLAATHRGMVRDHVAAWWFLWTTETQTATDTFGANYDATKEPFSLLAAFSGRPVIFARNAERFKFGIDWDRHVSTTPLEELRRLGYRVIEQRFPRKAYVVLPGGARAAAPPHRRKLSPGE